MRRDLSDWSMPLPKDWRVVGLKMDPEVYRQFKMLCAQRGWLISRVINTLVRDLVEENELVPVVQMTLVSDGPMEYPVEDPVFDRLRHLISQIEAGNDNSVVRRYLREEIQRLRRQGAFNADLFAHAEELILKNRSV